MCVAAGLPDVSGIPAIPAPTDMGRHIRYIFLSSVSPARTPVWKDERRDHLHHHGWPHYRRALRIDCYRVRAAGNSDSRQYRRRNELGGTGETAARLGM